MKKSILCSSLLAALLLVGCANKGDKPSTEPAPSPDTTEPAPSHKLVAEYDLSHVQGDYNANTVYFGPKGESVDITNEFTNKVENPTVSLASVLTGTNGVERAQVDQGPKVGGIKLNNNKGNNDDAKLTFNFAEGQTIDKIALELNLWSAKEGFTYKVNDQEFTVEAGTASPYVLEFEGTDLNTITVQCIKGRPVIGKVSFFNK